MIEIRLNLFTTIFLVIVLMDMVGEPERPALFADLSDEDIDNIFAD